MVFRLSELLERIRPAGAPGGAADGEQSLEQLAAVEIVELVDLLRAAEAEADLTLSRARQRAQRIRDEADEQVRRIRDDLPDRVAAAHVAGASLPTRQRDAELSRIADQTRRQIERLDAQAVTELPRIVDTAMAHIWHALELESRPDGGR